MASSTWKGFISFGLVSIPIRLFAAARSSRLQLHQLHKECNTRVRQPLFCPTCNRTVGRDEIVKGFEYEEGKYALINAEEIKKITPESSRAMDILAFVKSAEIDPLFFDQSFFVVPEDQGKKAYQLLLKTLEDTERVAVAKVTMFQREHVVFIRPYDHGLALHTIYYANEIREAPGYGKVDNVKLNPQEVKLAEQLVETLSEKFELTKYHDEFQDRLRELIEAKKEGHEIAATPQARRAPVIDMMAALKKSLENSSRSPKPVKAPHRETPRRTHVRRAAS